MREAGKSPHFASPFTFPLPSSTFHPPLGGLRVIETHRPPRPALELPMHRPGVAHEVLPRHRISGEELRGQERPFALIAALAGGDEVARVVTPPAREGDHMVKGSVFQSQTGPAVNATASTIPKGRTLDLALVLLVQHEASVAG